MAVSNISSTSNNIKEMTDLMVSDNYVIDKAILYCKYKSPSTQIMFGNILDNYRDYFEQYLVEEKVDKKYFYQPAYFAEDYYGTADLDFLVLYFSKITTLFEFDKPKIKVLPRERLTEINKLFVQYRTTVKESYDNPLIYYENMVLKKL